MLRVRALLIAVVLVAALSVPGMAGAEELKPKFGDIGGVYYTDVSENREACRQAIKNKIALCRQNTSFESNTKNRKYAGCLPVFRQQAQSCIGHFRFERGKCDGAGAARIRDFTGFSCEVTATVVEEGGEPERGPGIAPMDRRMTARTRVNLRAGPGTDRPVVGTLSTGQEVRVTGRTGDWLRIARPGGGTAFVHGQFMVAVAGQEPTHQPGGRTVKRAPAANAARIAELKAQVAAAKRAYEATRGPLDAAHQARLGTPHPMDAYWGAVRNCTSRSNQTCDNIAKQARQRAAQRYRAVFMKYKQAKQDHEQAFGRYMTLRRRYHDLLKDSR